MNTFKNLMGVNLVNSSKNVPNASWDVLETLYQDFIKDSDKSEKIPKKIHQIWIGNMPEKQKILIPHIVKNHPEWEYKLWTENDLDNLPMINKDLYMSLKNPGAKSDIARYEILYNEGGIYLDSDFFMVGNFDSVISLDFFTGVGHSSEPMVFNGLIGCTKKNNLIKIILEELKNKTVSNFDFRIEEIMEFCGPYFFSRCFFEYVHKKNNEKIVVLPTPYFYPLPATERFRFNNGIDGQENFIMSFNTDKTICIHLWFTSWQ